MDKHKEIARKMKFGNRKCSDSLCCFLTPSFAYHINVERTSNIAYLSLKQDGSLHDRKRLACENLELSLEDEIITFSCKVYDSRHPHCKRHPEGGDYIVYDGRFRSRIEVPRQKCTHHLLKEAENVLPFYLFDIEKFPQFEQYSLSVHEDNFLVPIPISK